MRFIILLFLVASCNGNADIKSLNKQNEHLQKEVDSLRNELHKCDMLIQSYENDPLNI